LIGNLVGAQSGESQAQYVYDAFGRRILEISPTETTAFVWDGNNLIVHGSEAAGYILEGYSATNEHVFSVRFTSAGYDSSAVFKYFTGPDGSVVSTDDGLWNVKDVYRYSAFGETTIYDKNGTQLSQSSVGNRFMYQGQLYDQITGTYSMRFREYDPRLGQFLSRDPIGLAGGNNRFAFVEGAPLTHSDPSGLLPRQPVSAAAAALMGDGGDRWADILGFSVGNGDGTWGFFGYTTGPGDAPGFSLENRAGGPARGPTGDAIQDGGPPIADTSYYSIVRGAKNTPTPNSSPEPPSPLEVIPLRLDWLGSYPTLIVPPGATVTPNEYGGAMREFYRDRKKYRAPTAPLRLLGESVTDFFDEHRNTIEGLAAIPFVYGGVRVVEEEALAGARAAEELAVFLDSLLEERVVFGPAAREIMDGLGFSEQALRDLVASRPALDAPILFPIEGAPAPGAAWNLDLIFRFENDVVYLDRIGGTLEYGASR
jgi:RHS repeat-associated protein